jgi:hypothetical protein
MSSILENVNARAIALGIPLSVHLDVTWRCNERCVHCYLDHDDLGEMTYDEIEGLLIQMAEAGVFFLTISGGEPLLRKDLFAIIRRAREMTFNVKLKTNAILIREPEAALIRDLGVETVQVSIYSHRPEVHDEITKVKGSLNRSLDAIRFMVSQGLKVTIANVVMNPLRLFRRAEAGGRTRDYFYDRSNHHAAYQRRPLAAAFEYRPQRPPRDNERQDRLQRGRSIHRGRSWSRRGRDGQHPVQRRPQRLLRLTLRRRLSMRAVPAAQRKRPPAEVYRHLEILASARGGSFNPFARSSGLFELLACCRMQPLPGPRVHGRQHARSVHRRLREIVRPNRHPQRKHVAESSRRGEIDRLKNPPVSRRWKPCLGGAVGLIGDWESDSRVGLPS